MRALLFLTTSLLVVTLLASTLAEARIIFSNGTIIGLGAAWKDTGYNLKPGYKYSFSLHAEAVKVPFAIGIAEAGFWAGPVKVELVWEVPPFTNAKLHLRVYVGEEKKLDKVIAECPALLTGAGKGDVSGVIEYTCDGEIHVKIQWSGDKDSGQAVFTTMVDEPQSFDIMVKKEGPSCLPPLNTPCVASEAKVWLTGKAACYAPPPPTYTIPPPPQQTPQPPSNPTYTPQPPTPQQDNEPLPPPAKPEEASGKVLDILGAAASATLTVLGIGFAGLALLIAYKQAKRRRLLAILLPIALLASLSTPVAHAKLTPLEKWPFEEWKLGVAVLVCGGEYGTAWWVNDQYVVTAAHVVKDKTKCLLVKGERQTIAIVVAKDDSIDVAVLKVIDAESFEKHIFPVRVNRPIIGEEAYVIGYPSELYVLYGGDLREMSSNPRIYAYKVPWYDVELGLFEIGRTDQGNSGGPIVDSLGNVIGLVSFALKTGVTYLFFGTSSDKIAEFLEKHGVKFQASTYVPTLGDIAVQPKLPPEVNASELPPPKVKGKGGEDDLLTSFLAGAAGGLVVDILILLVGLTAGLALGKRR